MITILSNCHIYNYLNYLLLEGDSFQFPTSFINNGQNAATTPLIFWDNLNSLGILNLDESMRNSFKEMQRDKKTFYESIHSKIIAAFIQSESSLEIEVVVDYLDRAFANFDKGVTFPYDMEDAYLIWMNCCLEELKQDLDFNIDSDIPEYEELNTAVEDAWLIALTLGNYTIDDKLVLTEICKELVCKSNLSPLERNKNNRIFEKISVLSSKNTGIFIPWLPHETQKQDGKNNFYSANYTNLMMASLHDLMKWILSWEKGFLNRIVVAQDKFDDLDLGQESVVSLERFIEIIDRPKNEAEYEACNSGSYSPGEEKRKANAIENNKVGEQIDEASALDYEEYEDDREFANNFLEEYYSECQTAQNAEDVNRLDQAKDCGEDKYGDLLLDDQDDFCNTLQRSIQLLNESTQYADVEPRKPRVLVTQAGRRQKSITARFQRHSVDQCEPLRGTACIDLKLQSSAEKLKAPIKLVTAEPFSSFPPNALSGAKGFDSAVDLSFKNTKDVVEFTTLSNAEENENSTNEAREDFEFLPLKSQKCKQNTLSSFQAVDFYSAADFDFLELYGPEAYKEGVCLSMPIPQTEEIQIQEQESNEIFEYEDSNYEYSEKSCKDKIPVHEKEVIAAPHCTVQYQFQEMIRQQSIILFEEERQEAESDAQDHGIIQEPSSNPPRLQISSTPRSRPRTGLLSYPIPETEEELVSVVQLFDDKWARPNDEKAFTTKNLTSAMTKLTDNVFFA